MKISLDRIMAVVVVGIFLVSLLKPWFVERINAGKWDTLISEDLGYKIDYPAGWTAETFPAGYENMHYARPEGTRAHFYLDSFFPTHQSFTLYWRANTDLEEAVQWSVLKLETNKNPAMAQSKNQSIGVGQYPALIRIYPPTVAYILKFIYIPTKDGVYILKFWSGGRDKNISAIFDHSLASFEIMP